MFLQRSQTVSIKMRMPVLVSLLACTRRTSAFAQRAHHAALNTATLWCGQVLPPHQRLGRLLSTSRVSPECASLLNDQVTRELEASQLYLSACIWCDRNNLEGMAAYMLAESDEERGHGLAIVAFARKRQIPLTLADLSAPQSNWKNPVALWTDIFYEEQKNSASLYKLADAAQECNDHALTAFLMPFHQNQVESEAHLETILSKVRDESMTPGMLQQLDSELGAKITPAALKSKYWQHTEK